MSSYCSAELEIHVPRFPVYSKLELHHCDSVHFSHIKVQKIDPELAGPKVLVTGVL